MGLFDLVDRTGVAVKALAARDAPERVTPFPGFGGTGIANVGGYGGWASDSERADFLPKFCDLYMNGIVAACSGAIAKAFASAPPYLEQKVDGEEDKWERIDHPIIHLLNNPNGFYGGDHLWTATCKSEVTSGDGFWKVVFNKARTEPKEIWWEQDLVPEFDSQNFISRYLYRVDGRPYYLYPGANGIVNERVDYAIHFRYQLDPRNPRRGWTPLNTVLREIGGDNAVATYHAALLNNNASMAGMITPMDFSSADKVTLEKLQVLVANLRSKFTGQGAGGISATNMPVAFHEMGYSPEKLALDKMPVRFESRTCAVLDIPGMVVGLAEGKDGRTYANYGEAILDFWMRNIIPLEERHGSEIESQMFPLYPDLDRETHRIAWDRSQIKALQKVIQDDKTANDTTQRENYKAGIPDLFTVLTRMGYDAPDITKGVRATQPQGQTDMSQNQPNQPQNATKSLPVVDTSKPQELTPWTDAELDAKTDDFSEGDVKQALADRTGEMRGVLGAKVDE